jgi:hypothetical protein
MASCGAADQVGRTRGGGQSPSLCAAVPECFVDHVRRGLALTGGIRG